MIKHTRHLFAARGPFQNLVQSWNYHRVPEPDGCIPIQSMEMTNKIPPLNLAFLSSTDEVVRMYECMGGHLTRTSTFGENPLKDIPHAYESRKALFDGCKAGWGELFPHTLHGRHDTIQNTLEKYINLTLSL